MRKLIFLLVLLVINTAAGLAQTAAAGARAAEIPPARNSGFSQLDFEVEFHKTKYLPFEPLFIRFKVSNQTTGNLKADYPSFLHDSTMKLVKPSGKTEEIRPLSFTSRPNPYETPNSGNQIFKPGESYEEERTPNLPVNTFNEFGRYRIQFLLYPGPVESNVVEIDIPEPRGVDREAYEFLNEHEKYFWYYGFQRKENPDELLKIFIERYAESGYGEYASFVLASRHRTKGELDKAEALLEKLRSSKNRLLSRQSEQGLAQIAEKKAEQERVKKP